MAGSDYKPIAEKAEAEVSSFMKLWRRRKWLAIVLVVIFVGWGLVPLAGWYSRGEKIASLEEELQQAKGELRFERSENRSLNEIVAPLIRQASKEFPGEEIKSSLRKLLEKMDQLGPRRQPVASASASAVIRVRSGTKSRQAGEIGLPMVAELVFGCVDKQPERNREMFSLWSDKFIVAQGADTLEYYLDFHFGPQSALSGEHLRMAADSIDEINRLDLVLWFLPLDVEVLGGKATLTLNALIRREFPIPAQKSLNGRVRAALANHNEDNPGR